MIQKCWKQLQQLDNNYKWSISWVKAHVGIAGDESAYKLAKQASQMSWPTTHSSISPQLSSTQTSKLF
jgi:ribonuclease HI